MNLNYQEYDRVIVAFSGGKDSLACFLNLLETGCPKEKIELWHHDIDGREGSDLMDWPVTRDYCKKFADAFGVKLYYSWKVGGFEKEMLRENCKTSPVSFETPDEGIKTLGGVRGKESTRRKFPQVSADLSVRWCSAYLKVDVASRALRNQDRLNHSKTLFLTGERAQESKARANYQEFEPHTSDNRKGRKGRYIDAWRPVHKWDESKVWEIIERFSVNPHPAYQLGWGRVSCAACIFGSANQWASLASINPKQVEKVSGYEKEFGLTIKRKDSVGDSVAKGTPYAAITPERAKLALEASFTAPIIMKDWKLPAGAYGESCGPT